MRVLRTWMPVAIIVAGLIVIALVRDENGLEGGLLIISAGLSVWLLNWFYGVSVRGEKDRDREDDARRYLDEHGYWPDEAPGEPEEPQPPPRSDPEDVHKRAARPEHPADGRRPRADRRPRRPSP